MNPVGGPVLVRHSAFIVVVMPFPSHIAQVLDAYGVRADTKAALYDLYVSMGEEVLAVFGDIAGDVAKSAASLTPDDTLTIRERVVRRYLERNHPLWVEGKPTASLWRPRELEGRASGLALPLGRMAPQGGELSVNVLTIARKVVGDAQPLPDGILMFGRNAHYGGRQETISFDVVASDLADASALGSAAGQQHTLPGSVGETSGTHDITRSVALIWEVQPNVYKPAGERNRNIAKLYRRHRNWHVVTLTAALLWLRSKGCEVFILRGNALATTHQVNPEKPVSPRIAALHERTVKQVITALGGHLCELTLDEETRLLESIVMNFALRKHAATTGVTDMIWRVEWPV